MSDVSAMSLALLRRFAEFLESLPEGQVVDLAQGRARLGYVPQREAALRKPAAPKKAVHKKAAPKKTPKRAAPKVDAAAMVRTLEAAADRDEGRDLLVPLRVADLRAVARAAGMTGVSRTPRADLLDQIVALIVGGRLIFAAIRDQ